MVSVNSAAKQATRPAWLCEWMKSHQITLWGVADLSAFETPVDADGRQFPIALSWAMPMAPEIMAGIQDGPTPAYARLYAKVNQRINGLTPQLAREITARGYRALPLAASDRTDPIRIKGDFPHKTAATRAGLGWIGRHCQLITRPFGSWVRLGTLFTDCPLPTGRPIERSFCGRCTRCVEACPAGALQGAPWQAGTARKALLDAKVCDRWKKDNYYRFHQGHNCGICSAVCPYGLKTFRPEIATISSA